MPRYRITYLPGFGLEPREVEAETFRESGLWTDFVRLEYDGYDDPIEIRVLRVRSGHVLQVEQISDTVSSPSGATLAGWTTA